MTNINEFNITEEELKEIEEITELAQGCTDYFLDSLINPETKEKVEYRKKEGCAVVEMECSALSACAAFRKVIWGMILYTADSLADVERYDERHWGGNADEYALTLSLDADIEI